MTHNQFIPWESGLQILLEHTQALAQTETLPLLAALGRISARDVRARIDQPPFDRSALDGYAVLRRDVASATPEQPLRLCLQQTIYAGEVAAQPLQPGWAVRLTTGAQLPDGADCVIKQEDTTLEGDWVTIFQGPGKRDNCIRRGEDLRQGQSILQTGQLIESAHLGLAAGQGLAALTVYARPRVCLVSTGSELVAPETALAPGLIYDSNRYLLAARVQQLGGQALLGPCLPDQPQALAEALEAQLAACDLLITTGGVSVGEKDYLPQVGRLLGAEQLFYGLTHKPGGRMLALQSGGKLLLCLSGNPFAAAAGFELVAAPVLQKLAGYASYQPRRRSARLRQGFAKASPQRRFLRAHYAEGWVSLAAQGHDSGSLSTLPGCNCLLDIPAGSPALKAEDHVEAILFAKGAE